MIMAGTLHTVTRSLRVPLYSGCNLKCFVVMSDSAVLFLRRKEDIPCRKTFAAKVLAWDACLPYQLLEYFFCEPHQPFGLKVGNDQREDSWGNFICNFRDGQDFVSFKIFGESAHPVFFVLFRPPPCWPFQAVGLFWAG